MVNKQKKDHIQLGKSLQKWTLIGFPLTFLAWLIGSILPELFNAKSAAFIMIGVSFFAKGICSVVTRVSFDRWIVWYYGKYAILIGITETLLGIAVLSAFYSSLIPGK